MARSRGGRRPPTDVGEFLLEFRRVGNAVKVSAIDPITGTEVSITGPASIGEAELSLNACNKLCSAQEVRRLCRSDDVGTAARHQGLTAKAAARKPAAAIEFKSGFRRA